MLATAHNNDLASIGRIRAEFQALVSGCGVYALGSRAKIKLTGNDRVRWLNGMVTNNIRDLDVGRGVYGFLLNPQGRILADLYAYNRGESLLLDTDQNQIEKILEIFDHYIIMDDVAVTNISQEMSSIGISGPKSADVLRAAGFDLSNLQPLQFRDVEWQGVAVTLVCGELERRDCYEIWLAPQHINKLWEALIQNNATATSDEAFELYRVALGIPRYGLDIRERDLPQETEQTRALNFSKGCYIGQEIVERIRSRGAVHRTFTGFIFKGNPPVTGSKIQIGGKDVGEITSVASLPFHDTLNVGLGYIRREANSVGKEVIVEDIRATVAELPFKAVFE